jgi:3-oxoacid CoA-transferase subunit A
VHRIVLNATPEKRIEKRTVSAAAPVDAAAAKVEAQAAIAQAAAGDEVPIPQVPASKREGA